MIGEVPHQPSTKRVRSQKPQSKGTGTSESKKAGADRPSNFLYIREMHLPVQPSPAYQERTKKAGLKEQDRIVPTLTTTSGKR